jgi:hypothetical protein
LIFFLTSFIRNFSFTAPSLSGYNMATMQSNRYQITSKPTTGLIPLPFCPNRKEYILGNISSHAFVPQKANCQSQDQSLVTLDQQLIGILSMGLGEKHQVVVRQTYGGLFCFIRDQMDVWINHQLSIPFNMLEHQPDLGCIQENFF